MKENLQLVAKALFKVFILLVMIGILIDLWTDSVDMKTIIMMMILLMDVLLDIKNNVTGEKLHLHLHFEEEKKKRKPRKAKKDVKKN